VSTVLVVAGGSSLPRAVLDDLPDDAYVIAADSGLDRAEEIGIEVDLVVGDMDSVEGSLDDHAVDVHPSDKDHTDLELALMAASRRDPERIVVVGGHGGRLDHLLANASLLCAPWLANHQIDWITDHTRATVFHTGGRIHGDAGDIVTLLAYGGDALGVKTDGLKWELQGETLDAGETRGVSNVLEKPVATINLVSGTVLAILVPQAGEPARPSAGPGQLGR